MDGAYFGEFGWVIPSTAGERADDDDRWLDVTTLQDNGRQLLNARTGERKTVLDVVMAGRWDDHERPV